jgi:hypothetical protein
MTAVLIAAMLCSVAMAQGGQSSTPVNNPAADEHPATATNAPGSTSTVMGFNASLATASQHDSSGGWSSFMTPELLYRFNKHFSGSFGLPVYNYILVDETSTYRDAKNDLVSQTLLEPEHLLLGDTLLVGVFEQDTKNINYTLTSTMGIPTGDDAEGLGAGQFTYAFINHGEHQISFVTPSIELGIDDSPNLSERRIHKSYTVVGLSAHFEAGMQFALPKGLTFQTAAYEELPLGTQKITTTSKHDKDGKEITNTNQESIGEDNGFQNTLNIPLGSKFTLSGFYDRSLCNHVDIAGFSITYQLRSPPPTSASH